MELNKPFNIKNGELFIDNYRILDIVSKYNTPLILYSADIIRDNYDNLYKNFKEYYKNFSIKYAVKANSNLAILSLLNKLGSGVDVSSIGEIYLAKSAGINYDKMLFSPNNIDINEFKYAIKNNIAINFDDINQFTMLKKFPDKISFRINPGIGKGEFKEITTGGRKSKFGINVDTAIDAYKLAKSKGITHFGIHMMAGSNSLNSEYFISVTDKFFDIAGIISKKAEITFDFIDIGGGFGIPYRENDKPLNINHISKNIIKTLKSKLNDYDLGNPELNIEPGRYIAGNSAIALGKINNIKRYYDNFAGTDLNMDTFLRIPLYKAHHNIEIVNKFNIEKSFKANIVGNICENTDRLGSNIYIPEPEINDIIAVYNAGAYVSSMENNYNGRLKPLEILYDNNNFYVIRKRDNLKDLVINMKIPDYLK